jgi:hypothetical protein
MANLQNAPAVPCGYPTLCVVKIRSDEQKKVGLLFIKTIYLWLCVGITTDEGVPR